VFKGFFLGDFNAGSGFLNDIKTSKEG